MVNIKFLLIAWAFMSMFAQANSHLPAWVELDYQVSYGAIPAGSANLTWKKNAQNQYDLTLKLVPVIGPKLTYVSEGRVTEKGIQPLHFYAERGKKRREQAKFEYEHAQIQFGEQLEKSQPLLPNAQDVLSLTFYLSQFGERPPKTAIQMTTGKKVYEKMARFKGKSHYKLGQDRIEVSIVESQNDKEKTEFWFAPDHHYLPIRIIRTDKDKTIDQQLKQLKINQSVILPTPKTH